MGIDVPDTTTYNKIKIMGSMVPIYPIVVSRCIAREQGFTVV